VLLLDVWDQTRNDFTWGCQIRICVWITKFWLGFSVRVQLKRDGKRWRTGGEVKGKLANGVGSPKPFRLPRNLVYPTLLRLMPAPRLPLVDWTDALADLNVLARFAERRNLVSARVPSHFKRSLRSPNRWGRPRYSTAE